MYQRRATLKSTTTKWRLRTSAVSTTVALSSPTAAILLLRGVSASNSTSVNDTTASNVIASPTPLFTSINDADSTLAPTAKPTKLPIKRVGNDGKPEQEYPLGTCLGDCDNDDECQEGLICYQRDANQEVPGCSGGETSNNHIDYCIPPPGSSSPSVSANPTQSPTISSVPTISPVPSAQPSTNPTPAPNTISERFQLRLYWDRTYNWQESRRERFWCWQCRSRCKEGTYIEIDHCKNSDFFQYHGDDQSYRPASDPNLCVTEDGFNSESRPLRLKKCTGSRRQKWANYGEDGFNLDKSKQWEIMPAEKKGYCVTQMHHPKAHERVFVRRCSKPRTNDTSKWVLF